jgi:NAD-dependent dihydropyrimidine dehydrogenase PreA subunit
MAMYHSWDSQNAWLRQIHTHNYLYRESEDRAAAQGHRGRRLDVGRIAVGQGALHVPLLRGGRARHGVDLERHRQGRRRLGPGRTPTSRKQGFLLNHLISEELPPDGGTFPTPTRSPARPAGTTCACASTRPPDAARGPHLAAVRPTLPCGARRTKRLPRRPARSDGRGWSRKPRRTPRLEVQTMSGLAMTQLALVIDLNVCVGCHACVTSCKEWNTSGGRPLADDNPYGKPTRPAPSSTACRPSRSASSRTRRPCTSRRAACTARTRPACRCARPAPATSAPRTASCWSTTTSASAASTAPGPAPTARASSTSTRR